MKRAVSNLLLILAAAVGMILLAYPHVSNQLADRKQSFVIQEYDKTLQQMNTDRMEKEWERATLYNQGKAAVARNDSITQSEKMEEYTSLLNVNGDGVMGYIKIPKIQINLTIRHGTTEGVLSTGIGHLKETALPVGGEGSHCVLTGHTGLNFSRIFTDLPKMEIGDEFYLYILDQVLAYRVDQVEIVEPEDTALLKPVEGEDHVTLLTCTPYGVNSHRLLVRGKRMDYTKRDVESRIEMTRAVIGFETILLIASGGLLLSIVIVIGHPAVHLKRVRRWISPLRYIV